MTEHADKYAPTNLDLARIEAALWEILREYRRDFGLTPITEVQDLRAFSLLWAALFVPEAISSRLRRALIQTGKHYRGIPDYGATFWFPMLPLEAALFVLTGSELWLPTLLNNIDHHKSSLRTVTIESLALIAGRLKFDAETLRRIAHNLEVAHFFCEWPVILFAISKGTEAYKRRTVEQWLNSNEMNPHERAVLEELAAGGMVHNPFLHRALRTQQYLMLQIARNVAEEAAQSSLEDDWDAEPEPTPGDRMTLFANQTADLHHLIWERLSAHPLTASMIQLGDNL